MKQMVKTGLEATMRVKTLEAKGWEKQKKREKSVKGKDLGEKSRCGKDQGKNRARENT